VAPAADEAVAAQLGIDPHVVEIELDAVAHSFGYGHLPRTERRLRTALTAIRSGLARADDE
jgi:hypothetical protein